MTLDATLNIECNVHRNKAISFLQTFHSPCQRASRVLEEGGLVRRVQMQSVWTGWTPSRVAGASRREQNGLCPAGGQAWRLVGDGVGLSLARRRGRACFHRPGHARCRLQEHPGPTSALIGNCDGRWRRLCLSARQRSQAHIASCQELPPRIRGSSAGWPTCSPDLSPIEHIWDVLGRGVANKRVSNKGDLKRHLQDAWNGLDHDILNKLVPSIPRRLPEVIDRKGGHTKDQLCSASMTLASERWQEHEVAELC